MKNQSENEPICCPPFNPDLWDEKVLEWNNKKFIKDSVFTLFYMPVNFAKVMVRFNKTVEKAGAEMQDALCLSDHTSKWNMDLYLAVNKEVPGAKNVTLSGKYFCKVYEGPFRDTEKWCKDFEGITQSRRLKTGKIFMWYTTCPKCAKKYGKNFVAILGKVE